MTGPTQQCLYVRHSQRPLFWELRQIMRIEAWKEQYAAELPGWLDAIGQMDALNSLATFAYNHPDYIYPKMLKRKEREKKPK